MEPGITWYEVLGVLPGAAADRVRRRYEERAALLRGELIAGAPVPDVRGLFYDVCLKVTGRLGIRVVPMRLTPRPMPVDGLVVDQSPRAPGKVRRGEAVTVHVWHPPAAGPGAR